MSHWWNPFDKKAVVAHDAPKQSEVPKPVPPPEPPKPFDPDDDLEKHIKLSAYRGWIGVRLPSMIAGRGDLFTMNIPASYTLIKHLERAILAAEVMEGKHDELLDDDEPEPKKDAECGAGDKP